ncbi:MAG: N-acetyltransferase [Lachnospiraceae bacterium]|nr:N-acetyltransferase [Lachnospiraceae bacterium]
MSFFVHDTAIVEEGANIGEGTRIWHHAHVRTGSTIGKNCNIGKNCYVDLGAVIGSGVKIQNNVSVYHGVVIEDDVFVGPAAVFTNDFYPRAFINDWKVSKTLIKKGASIGANATIVCGNTIGEYATIGAGSVVTKDVKPHALMVGNPARQIGWVCKCGCKLDEMKMCPECGEEYKEL